MITQQELLERLLIGVSLDAGSHMRKVIKAMIDGVAFRRDALWFDVYSHEGDELGQISTADVNYAIHFMKKAGRPVGKLTHITMQKNPFYCHEPAFTFAWVDWLLDKNGVRY